MRARVEKQIAKKQKEDKEDKLREMAQLARADRAGIRTNCKNDECLHYEIIEQYFYF